MEKFINKYHSIRTNLTYKLSLIRKYGKVDTSSGHLRIYGFSKYLKSSNDNKKALISYLSQPVLDDLHGLKNPLFSNSGAGRTIPKVLNQLGYQVDVMNWDDTAQIHGEYDLVIYHGGTNIDTIKNLKTSSNKLLYYSTGSYWKYHNTEEEKRLQYFEDRHHKRYKLDREIKDSEEVANSMADTIISLGNKDTARTYNKFKHVYNLEGGSMPVSVPRKIVIPKDNIIGFVFIAGPGNLHKGLDILLDAWQALPPNYHLHIITYLDKEFIKLYKKQLYKTQNIHTHGYVLQRSQQFYEIINTCQYSVLLSCSEGSPGSVIESMCQGLIPIVTKQSHISIDGFGKKIAHVSVDRVEKALLNAGKVDRQSIAKKQKQLRKWAIKQFSVESYEHNLTKIIKKVML